MKFRPEVRPLAGLLIALLLTSGCGAARSNYRRGQKEAKQGNWDQAVGSLTVALQKDPDNINYKIALENARIQASRQHYADGRKALVAQDLDKAADEFDIAAKYDPGNKSAADELAIVRNRIRIREDEKKRLAEFDDTQRRAQATRLPLPALSPRDPRPVALNFAETGVQKILDTLAKVAGVNILYDEAFKDKKTDAKLTGLNFQEALDRITSVNRLFYKVVDQNTIIIVPETPAKRRSYEEQILRTFYLQNADAAETLNLVKTLSGLTKAMINKELQAITVVGSPDKVAIAERVVALNDKAKGEVMIEVQILNVATTKLKDYGLRLSQYEAAATFSPTGAEGELDDGFTNLRAHMLSSFNLADFVVSMPSTLFAKFLQSDNNTRILAAPRLRAAEGKTTSLKIGTEVPIPVTTFQATQTGGTTFSPATSFQYRNVGVNLDVTPKVNPAGDISLELTAEFSLLGAGAELSGQELPTFLSRNVKGVLRMRDGETSLIGGLVQRDETDTFAGVLGLQSIPILNKVFTSRRKEVVDTEILISLTPHILRGPKVVEEDLVSLFVGTEEIPKVAGARPPLFGPMEPQAKPAAPVPRPGPTPRPVPPPEPPQAEAVPPLVITEVPPAVVPEPTATSAVPTGASGPAADVQLSPREAVVKVGETVTISLVLVGATDVSGITAVFTYDPSVVEVVEALPGSLLTLDGAAMGSERAFEPGRARVRFTRPGGASGSGAVVTLRLRGVKDGESPLGFESFELQTAAGAVRGATPATGRLTVVR